MISRPKRPRDFSQAAKLVIDIATGEKPNRDPTPEEEGKDTAAVTFMTPHMLAACRKSSES
jgi:hypothetical protein